MTTVIWKGRVGDQLNDMIKQKIMDATLASTECVVTFAQALLNHDTSDQQLLAEKARRLHGLELPGFYFSLAGSRDIFITNHMPIVNGVPHSHDFFELIYVVEGSVKDDIDGHSIRLSKGDICIHNPHALHSLSEYGEDDFVVNIGISKELLREQIFMPIYKGSGTYQYFLWNLTPKKGQLNFRYYPSPDERVRMLVETVIDEFFNEPRSDLLTQAALLLLFGNLFRSGQTDEFLTSLTNVISEHMCEADIKMVAHLFGYHEKYFSRLVKQKTGLTFHAFLTELRMRQAATLLRFTDMSIETIAVDIGYKDPSAFYHQFKRMYGISPGKYKNQK